MSRRGVAAKAAPSTSEPRRYHLSDLGMLLKQGLLKI
jgi:hypothetical protein